MKPYALLSYEKLSEAIEGAIARQWSTEPKTMSFMTGRGGARMMFRHMLRQGCSKAYIRTLVVKTGGKYVFTSKIN